MKNLLLIAMACLCQIAIIQAQHSVSGAILDGASQPLPYANVLLLNSEDSTLVKGEISDEQGNYEIIFEQTGTFFIEATMVGLETTHSAVFTIPNDGATINLAPIQLMEEATALSTVEIKAKKPLFEQKIDRMVVNVQGSITSGGATALEVLERSPGVIVNRQNAALSMAGKQGVVVMINGKINRTPPEAVVQMLQGMSADNIEKIELITTPPADFDAEGDAGFINIVLKQSADLGFNGSITTSFGVGQGSTGSVSTDFNYRKNKVNFFGNYSLSRDAQKQVFDAYRKVTLENDILETYTVSDRDPIQLNHNFRLGMDYQLSEKSVIGALLSAYDNKWSMDALNEAAVTVNGTLDTLITLDNSEINQWKHVGGNLNFQHHFNKDSRLNFDADYLYYYNENPTNYLNTYTNGQGDLLFEETTRSGKITPVRIGVGKVDFSKKLQEKISMDMGAKMTISRFINDVVVGRLTNEIWINDPNFTAKYDLEEDILAAYTSFDIELNKQSSMKIGLRYEYTRSNLGTAEESNIVDRKYGNFFPTAFFSHNFSDDKTASIAYSRRITRPTFNDMAPFVIFIDPNTFFSGNSALQPAISNTLKADLRIKTVLFSVSVSQDDDAIARFQPRFDPESKKTVIGAENLNYRQTASAFINFPLEITEWWQMRLNVAGSWQKVNARIGTEEFDFKQQSWNGNMAHSFQLPNNFSGEISGFYFSPSLWGTNLSKSFYGLNLGIQKDFNQHGRLRFGIDDILESIKWSSSANVPEQNLVTRANYDFSVRTFKISYARNFGNKQLKSSRNRATGAEEERGRVN